MSVGSSERKLLTVLFVDLCGYTELCRLLDPEDVVARVQPIMTGLRRLAKAHGALLGSQEGDGFHAVFGLPVAHDDDPLRAVHCAARMREFLSSRSGDIKGMHAGIATGEVLVTWDSPTEWLAAGSAYNLASRLCDAADVGEVYVDSRCAALAGPSVGWTETRVLELKGYDSPEPVKLLEGVADRGSLGDLFTGELVGREGEMRLLARALEEALTTHVAQVLLVVGDAGIGKSHLVQTFGRSAGSVALVLGAGCPGYGSEYPLAPIVQALGVSGRAGGGDELARALSASGVAGGVALVARLRSLLPDGSRGSETAGTGRDEAMVAAVRRILVALALARPVVVLLEDVHWASSDLWSWLNDLSQDPLAGPVMVVATARPGTPAMAGINQLNLGPLSPEHGAELVRAELASDATPEVVQTLLARTGNNPLFLRECAAWLRESGSLVAPSRGPGTRVEGVPESVRLVLAARLDALSPPQKAMLQAASVWGDDGPPDTLRLLVGLAPHAKLPPAPDNRLFSVRDGRWFFAHSLIRDVAYASLPKLDRARRHRLLLESGALVPAQRAHHARAAYDLDVGGDPRARQQSAVAVVAEVAAYVDVLRAISARATYDAVVAALPVMDQAVHIAPEQTCALLAKGSAAARDLGEFEEAELLASRALTVAGAMGSATAIASAQVTRGHALSRLGALEEAREQGQLALFTSRAMDDQAISARALMLIGETYRYESIRLWVDQLELAYHSYDSIGDLQGAAEAARWGAYLLSMSGGLSYERWIDRARGLTDADEPRGQAWIARVEAFAAAARGSWFSAERASAVALQRGEEAGLRDVVADALLISLDALSATGRLDDHGLLRSRLLAMCAGQPTDGRIRSAVAASSARALLRCGQPHEAQGELALAVGAAEQLGNNERVPAFLAQADVAADMGNWVAARDHYRRASVAAAGAELNLLGQAGHVGELRMARELRAVIDPGELFGLAQDLRDAGAMGYLAVLSAVFPDVADGLPLGDAEELPEVVALRAERVARAATADEAPARWAEAAEAWRTLGATYYLARALANAGDQDGSQLIREAIGLSPASSTFVKG